MCFNLGGSLHVAVHGGGSNLHSHQQCTKVPFSLHPPQRLLSLVSLMIAILTGCEMIFYCGFDLHFPDGYGKEMESKQIQHSVVDVTGDGSKVRCYKEQYCTGT